MALNFAFVAISVALINAAFPIFAKKPRADLRGNLGSSPRRQ
jgi:hypothetical protein